MDDEADRLVPCASVKKALNENAKSQLRARARATYEQQRSLTSAAKQPSTTQSQPSSTRIVIRPARAAAGTAVAKPCLPAKADAPYDQLHKLSEAVEEAPRFGLNGRALILRAATVVAEHEGSVPHAATPVQPHGPKPQAAPKPTPVKWNLGKLLEAVPLAERPFIVYVPRSNIPRLTRQECANSLLGGYLAMILQRLGHAHKEAAVQVVGQDSELRRAAAQAAAAHEQVLYRQVTSKTAYQALAAQAVATDAHLAKGVLEQLQPRLGRPPASSTPEQLPVADGTAAACSPGSAAPAPGSSPGAAEVPNGTGISRKVNAPGAKHKDQPCTPSKSVALNATERPTALSNEGADALLNDLFESDSEHAETAGDSVADPGEQMQQPNSSLGKRPQPAAEGGMHKKTSSMQVGDGSRRHAAKRRKHEELFGSDSGSDGDMSDADDAMEGLSSPSNLADGPICMELDTPEASADLWIYPDITGATDSADATSRTGACGSTDGTGNHNIGMHASVMGDGHASANASGSGSFADMAALQGHQQLLAHIHVNESTAHCLLQLQLVSLTAALPATEAPMQQAAATAGLLPAATPAAALPEGAAPQPASAITTPAPAPVPAPAGAAAQVVPCTAALVTDAAAAAATAAPVTGSMEMQNLWSGSGDPSPSLLNAVHVPHPFSNTMPATDAGMPTATAPLGMSREPVCPDCTEAAVAAATSTSNRPLTSQNVLLTKPSAAAVVAGCAAAGQVTAVAAQGAAALLSAAAGATAADSASAGRDEPCTAAGGLPTQHQVSTTCTVINVVRDPSSGASAQAGPLHAASAWLDHEEEEQQQRHHQHHQEHQQHPQQHPQQHQQQHHQQHQHLFQNEHQQHSPQGPHGCIHSHEQPSLQPPGHASNLHDTYPGDTTHEHSYSQHAAAHVGCSDHTSATHSRITKQVAEFVKGILDPLYHAQLVTKDDYKTITRKAVDKIMQRHAHEQSAEFLVKEYQSITKFVLKLRDHELQRASCQAL